MTWRIICKQALESLLTEGCGRGPRSVVSDTRERAKSMCLLGSGPQHSRQRQLLDVLLNYSDLGISFIWVHNTQEQLNLCHS